MSEIFNGKDKKKAEEDKKLKELHSKWTKEQEFLLAEWAEKASCYRWLHGRAEKKYRRSNYAFTIPVIIMSTLTGTANFAMDSFVPAEHKKTAMAAVGGVNILAGIISTLQNFLRYAELMEAHRSSGVAWSKLGRDICIELALDPPRRKPARDFLNICRAEYDRLIEQSPLMDDSIIAQFHAKFKNLDINKPEMCNGLDKCEIYQPSKEEKAAEMLANVTTKMANTKKRMFTIDKPRPKPPSPEIIKSNVDHSKTENKHELAGLATLGKVSSLKHIQSKKMGKPKKITKKEIHSELKSVLEQKESDEDSILNEINMDEIEELLPKTPKLVITEEVKPDIENGIKEDNKNDIIVEVNDEQEQTKVLDKELNKEQLTENSQPTENEKPIEKEQVDGESEEQQTNDKESQTDDTQNLKDEETADFLNGITDE